MKKYYSLLLFICAFNLNAQTTINYPQRVANYNAFFDDGGGKYDNATDQLGMWANFNAKQSVAWRNFTTDGTTSGTTTTMQVGDSFTITVSATQASYGVIGLALLSNPTATTSWEDRINNYAVQVNLNGNSGANDPWEVVSNGGAVNASSINGSTTYNDFKFKFILNSPTTMSVDINDGAEIFNVTLNNQNITGYSIYLADDWNGSNNADIFWKPTTQYTYAQTLGTSNFTFNEVKLFPNPISNTFTVNKKIKKLDIYSITGKLIKSFDGGLVEGTTFNIENFSKGVYIAQLENEFGAISSTKIIKL